MVSICDDLRRLDRMLLHLAHGSGGTFQNYLLLSLVRRRVQSLEKKARSLGGLYIVEEGKPSGSGGAPPLFRQSNDCFLSENSFQKNLKPEACTKFLCNEGASYEAFCSCLLQEQAHSTGAYYVQ